MGELFCHAEGRPTECNCPDCHQPIHAECGTTDPVEVANGRPDPVCVECDNKRKATRNKTTTTTTTKRTKKTAANEKTQKKKKKAPPKGPAPLKLDAPKEDNYLNQKQVAYCLDSEEWLRPAQEHAVEVGGKKFVTGTVLQRSKGAFTITWHNTRIQNANVALGIVVKGMEVYEEHKKLKDKETRLAARGLNQAVLAALTAVTEDHELGDPLDSDAEEEDAEDDSVPIGRSGQHNVREDFSFPSQEEWSPPQSKVEGLVWEPRGQLERPMGARSSSISKTKLKEEHKHMFSNHLSSLMCPIGAVRQSLSLAGCTNCACFWSSLPALL